MKGFGTGAGNPTLLQWRLNDQVLSGGGAIKLASDTPPQTRARAGAARGVERFESCIFKFEVLRVVSVPSAPAVVIKPVAGHSAEG